VKKIAFVLLTTRVKQRQQQPNGETKYPIMAGGKNKSKADEEIQLSK
jgi:hypothetical protein